MERKGEAMYRLFELKMNSERKTNLVEEELPDTDEENDFNYFEDNYEDDADDEDNEREYCD